MGVKFPGERAYAVLNRSFLALRGKEKVEPWYNTHFHGLIDTRLAWYKAEYSVQDAAANSIGLAVAEQDATAWEATYRDCVTDRYSYGRTGGRTDKASYSDARAHEITDIRLGRVKLGIESVD